MSDPATILPQALLAFDRDDWPGAERLCREALAADAAAFDAYHLLALAQLRLERPREALASCDQALALRPDEPLALANRAVALDALGRYEEAVASNDRALARRPEAAVTLSNRGNALSALGRFDEALASYDRALALQPEFADCRFNRALLLLRRGGFAEGWREYEWRRRVRGWRGRNLGGPEWRGESLEGRRLLLSDEGRTDDTIPFARFAPLVAGRGGEVVIEVEPPLAPLMRGLAGIAQVIARGDALPAFDYHLPLGSLPGALGITDLGQMPAVPYLAPDQARLAAWTHRLPPAALRVGVAWRVAPGAGRNPPIPLAGLAPLGRVPGVRLIGLDPRGEADEPAATPIVDLGADLAGDAEPLLALAAVMAQLDLIIATDGPVAHLAGALGRPVWVLLMGASDWRWPFGESTTPWYPTARLFRQPRRDAWDAALRQARDALAEAATGRTGGAPAGAAAPPPGGTMPGYVISLARRPDRRTRFLQWNSGKGIDIDVFDAVDGQTLSKQELYLANLIDDPRLNYTLGFLGSALSHRALWERCIEIGRPILVFEDDVYLPDGLHGMHALIAGELAQGCDILYLGYNRDAVVSVGYGGGSWCSISFDPSSVPFALEAAEHSRWSAPAAHCILDTRLVWGITAYAISPAGAQSLLRHCFPLSSKPRVRMFGSGRVLIPYGLDGMANAAMQQGLIRARLFFPPLVIGPNDAADSDNLAKPG